MAGAAAVPVSGGRATRGWLLVGLIIILTGVVVALVGVTYLLVEHRRTTSLRQNQTRAIYLAQAGVMQELYDYRRGQEVSRQVQTIVAGPAAGTADDDIAQVTGPQADFLLVNMRGDASIIQQSHCSAQRDRIHLWSMRNVLASGEGSLVIDQVRVNWSPVVAGEGIIRMDFNGTGQDWPSSGCPSIPADTNINITNQSLNAAQRWANNRVWFTSSAMDGKDWIDVTLVMTDGSERTARWDRLTVANRTADITLRSIGTVRRGAMPFEVWRRLQVEYRVCADVSGNDCDTQAEEQSTTSEGAIISIAELTTLTP